MTDLKYNLSKYIQFEVFENCFEVVCLHQHKVPALNREEWKAAQIFVYRNNSCVF